MCTHKYSINKLLYYVKSYLPNGYLTITKERIMRTVKTPTVEMYAQPSSTYVDIGLLALLAKEAFIGPCILQGPKGTGKTLGLEEFFARTKTPFVRFDCNEWTTVRDLQGTTTQTADEDTLELIFAYALGCLTCAIAGANEVGKFGLILEEINTLTPNAQKVLNPLADFRQSIAVPKIGKVFRLYPQQLSSVTGTIVSIDKTEQAQFVIFNDDSVQEIPAGLGITVKEGDSVKAGDPLTVKPELWVVGTMNPSYAGTYQINEDMNSRFDFISVPYMPKSEEKKVLEKLFPGKLTKDQRDFVKRLQNLALETRKGAMDPTTRGYALSARDLCRVVERFQQHDAEYALNILAGKFKGEDHKNYKARVKRFFGIEVRNSLFGSVDSAQELTSD